MKKLIALVTVAVMLSLTVLAGQALAAPDAPHLNWGSQVNAGECPAGKLVINVTHKVVNDADSGVAGNNWAYDNYNKTVQVWQVGPGEFCALARYVGSFTTNAGPSPENTDPDGIAAGIKGTYEGGYRSTIFSGTLKASPGYSLRGNLGTFDYGYGSTPFSWVNAYFSSTSGFDLAWWGWVYHGGKNGTWVNASTGNLGDITD
ncbi:MAG: hypothetical protein M1370_00910 [Bacteroidetes bacterium]|nr:hypothetical protein [Bacteroidota bacterium]MCL5025547.1 hypothetical protein [Chloroflexota bacterium]